MKFLFNKTIALSLALLMLTLPAATATGQAAPLKRFDGYSTNWGGYTIVVGGEIATTASGNKYWSSTSADPIISYTVSYVYGEWIVPDVKAGKTGMMADTSVWVGIDGYASNTVEQLGTSSEYDPNTGQMAHYAWWEMYPKFSHQVRAITVNQGDHVSAYVKFTPDGQSQDRGSFVLSLTDTTNGNSFTITQGPREPSFYVRSSAEWVVERGAFYDTSTKQAYFAELAEFDASITFTNCQATVTTYGGPVHYDRIWMTAPYPTGYGYGDAYYQWPSPTPPGTRWIIAWTSMKTGNLIDGGSFNVTWNPYLTVPAGKWRCQTPEGSTSCPKTP